MVDLKYFGAESVATKIPTEANRSFQNNLRLLERQFMYNNGVCMESYT